MSTTCHGECGTAGWRLLSDDIDSGIGHGSIADVVLQVDTVLETAGLATWNFSIVCKDYCRMQFIDANVSGGTKSYYATNATKEGPYSYTMHLARGEHKIQVVFSKYVESVFTHRENRMIIHGFNITGVASGGASSCAPCPAGYFSIQSSSECSPCPAGTYSEEGSSTCSICPEGTYSKDIAVASCKACGPNTRSQPDRLDCDEMGCTYSPRAAVVYNLSALQSDEMYGPIWDVKGHAFYLNPCQKQHSNRSCFDVYGKPIQTHACQAIPLGYSMDLGHVVGYYPFRDAAMATDPSDPSRSGLVVQYTDGTPGCKADGVEIPRSTKITFICDPFAGIGYPETVEPVEVLPCQYQFKWTSLYACPICTLDDFQVVHGKCEDNGLSLKAYVPKNYPNRCHSGLNPASEYVPCTSISKQCPSGTYLPLNAKDDDECVPAAAGKYVINGGGFVVDVFDEWDSLPSAFDRTSSWKLLGEVARSGPGDSSLVASVYLVQPGYVSFLYKVVAAGLDELVSEGGFYFDIDGSSYTHGVLTTHYRYAKTMVSLSAGTHILTWRFIGGVLPSANLRGHYAVVDRIIVTGLEYSARQDIPCREGSYQNLTGQTTCNPCPAHYKSTAGQATCTQCPEKTYSLPQSSDCDFMWTCEAKDYTVVYSPCQNGKRRKTYVPIQPKFCFDHSGKLFNDNNTLEPCPECPPGFYQKSDDVTYCEGCPPGQYLHFGICANVPAGSYSLLNITYFNQENYMLPYQPTESGLPPGFRTSCSGRCGTGGWRIANSTVESGFHNTQSEIDSELYLETEFFQEGSITFDYRLTYVAEADKHITDVADNGLSGFQFFIDGKPDEKSVLYRPFMDTTLTASIQYIPAGPHTFHWVFHQPLGSNTRNRAILSNIRVVGSSRGSASHYSTCQSGTFAPEGSVVCDPCKPGSFSSQGMSSCSVCPNNRFTPKYGSSECEPCGASLNATEDRTACDTNGCHFSFPQYGLAYNLSALNRQVTVLSDDAQHRFSINLCHKTTVASQCFDANNVLINDTHICDIDLSNGVGSNSGRILNVLYDDVQNQLKLKYTKGVSCGVLSLTSKYTDIVFVCDPNITHFTKPQLLANNPCHLIFEWRHIAACPVCTPNDYVEEYGECVGGFQSKYLVRKSECNGEVMIRGPDSSRPCKPLILMTFSLVITLGSLFLFLIFGLIFVGLRNRKLSDQYEKMLQQSSVKTNTASESNTENVE